MDLEASRRPRALLLALSLVLVSCTMPVRPRSQDPRAPERTSPSSFVTPTPPERVDDVDVPSGTGSSTQIPERLLPGGLLELGEANAPVSLLVFTNHACDYCQSFQREHLPRLLTDFVRPGKLRVVLVAFPLRKYPGSDESAALLLCASASGKGQAMNELLFATGGRGIAAIQSDEASSAFDLGALRLCAASPDTTKTIVEQRSWARALGVRLIPSFYLQGEQMVGLPDYAELRGAIEEALRDADTQA